MALCSMALALHEELARVLGNQCKSLFWMIVAAQTARYLLLFTACTGTIISITILAYDTLGEHLHITMQSTMSQIGVPGLMFACMGSILTLLTPLAIWGCFDATSALMQLAMAYVIVDAISLGFIGVWYCRRLRDSF